MTEVHAITSAGRSQSDQVRSRERNYLITMGIRMLCFIPAFLVSGWLRWVFVAGAVLLPMFAVIFANSGTEKRSAPDTYFDPANQPLELPAGEQRS